MLASKATDSRMLPRGRCAPVYCSSRAKSRVNNQIRAGSRHKCHERTSSTQSPLLSVPSSLAFRMHGERCNIFMSCPFVTGRAEIPFG